jgi:hypothetical protein
MKKFNIVYDREEGLKTVVYTLNAINLEDAKVQFSEFIKKFLDGNRQVFILDFTKEGSLKNEVEARKNVAAMLGHYEMFTDEELEKDIIEVNGYVGPGYYSDNTEYWSLPLLFSDEPISKFLFEDKSYRLVEVK